MATVGVAPFVWTMATVGVAPFIAIGCFLPMVYGMYSRCDP